MPRIRIVTDSTCDIPDALLRQLDIAVVPLSVCLSGDIQPDRGSGAAEHLLRNWRPGMEAPEALAPSIEDFTRVYRSLRETCDGVLSIHVSSRLSETVANASTAREAFGLIGQGGPFPIAVVDSMSMSMGLGWLVLAMSRALTSGLDLPRLARMATRIAGQTHVAFFTEHLDGLRNLPSASKSPDWSSLTSLRPLFNLEEGQVVVYDRTRTRARARDALYDFVEDFPKIGELAVIHTGAPSDLEHLMTRIGAIYPRERVLILHAGAATSAWLGPEALGVAVIEGEE